MIAIFRNRSKAASANVALPLLPEGKFKVHSVVTNQDIGTFTKSDWARGVAVRFPDSEPVEILEVTAVK